MVQSFLEKIQLLDDWFLLFIPCQNTLFDLIGFAFQLLLESNGIWSDTILIIENILEIVILMVTNTICT
jgi:hypothetical protein